MQRAAILIFVALTIGGSTEICRADVTAGVTIDEGGVKSFYLAIGDYFGAKEKEIAMIRRMNVSDEELPVVYFLARRAGVSPNAIIRMRLDGKSWMDISLHFGLSAEVFYVPVKKRAGPPYGKAYGHFKNKKRGEWASIRLSDSEIINFVNLRFISDHYGYSPDEIIAMRERGRDFVVINREVKKARELKIKKSAQAASEKERRESKPKKSEAKKK
jgi:hypothetical protein